MRLHIRPATPDDLPAIVAIHNEAIELRSVAHMQPFSVAERQDWFAGHSADRRPILVAESVGNRDDGDVLGWLSLSDYRPGRPATAKCAEISYFVAASARRQGVATELVREAIGRCADCGIDRVLAVLPGNNEGSRGLLEKFGFVEWGRLPGVVQWDGDVVDHLYYGLVLSPGD